MVTSIQPRDKLGDRRSQDDKMPPLCRRNMKQKEEKEVKKEKRVVTLEEEKIVRWAVNNKENWRREEVVEVDHRKIEKMVPQKFLR